MTIPSKPLEVNLDTSELTLGELMIFEPGSFTISGFVQFVGNHTNWTDEDIKAVTVNEMKDVTEQLRAALQSVSVPLAS